MCLQTNIARRAGSARYYARLGVPLDLQAALQKKELWRSLRTSDPKEARARVLPVLQEWRDLFADLRRRHEPTADDLQSAVWDHYEAELDRLERGRESLPTAAEIESAKGQFVQNAAAGTIKLTNDPLQQMEASLDLMALADRAKMSREFRAAHKDEIKRDLGRAETKLIKWAADDVIAKRGLSIEKGSHAYRCLCQRLLRAHLEALERAGERDRGDFTGKPQGRADPAARGPRSGFKGRAARNHP
jgi:hypothetical protein